MKTTGKCTKCNSNDIYCDNNKRKHTDSRYLPVNKGSWSYISIDVYVCLSCGYVEEFVSDNSLNDTRLMEKLKEHWKKL